MLLTGKHRKLKNPYESLEKFAQIQVFNHCFNIKSKMGLRKYTEEGDFGTYGFDYDIKKAVLSIEYAYQKSVLMEVEKILMKQQQ